MVSIEMESKQFVKAIGGFDKDIVQFVLPPAVKAAIKYGARESKQNLAGKIKHKKLSTGALKRALWQVYPRKQRQKKQGAVYGVWGVRYGEKYFRDEKRKKKDGTPYATGKGGVRKRRPPQYHPTQEKEKGYIAEAAEDRAGLLKAFNQGAKKGVPKAIAKAKKRGMRKR